MEDRGSELEDRGSGMGTASTNKIPIVERYPQSVSVK